MSAPLPSAPSLSVLWPIWAFLATQALTLALSANEAQIWFQEPAPFERFALWQMIAVQLAVAALLAPALLADWPSLITAAAPIPLFDFLAAHLSGTALSTVALASATIFLWMTCATILLRIAAHPSATRPTRIICAMIIALYTFLPPILFYVAADWANPQRLLPAIRFTPLAVFDLAARPTGLQPLMVPAAIAIVLLVVQWIARAFVAHRRNRDKLSTSLFHT